MYVFDHFLLWRCPCNAVVSGVQNHVVWTHGTWLLLTLHLIVKPHNKINKTDLTQHTSGSLATTASVRKLCLWVSKKRWVRVAESVPSIYQIRGCRVTTASLLRVLTQLFLPYLHYYPRACLLAPYPVLQFDSLFYSFSLFFCFYLRRCKCVKGWIYVV